jgi:glyoxylase-like metal-dependent hydrolase (beta-lactamase superfamily II)
MRPKIVAAVLLALGTVCIAHAQPPPRSVIGQERPVIQTYFLRNEVYFLTNGQANAVALVTADGVVLLDAMPAGWGPAVTGTVQRLTYMPVTAIINTHAHEDHAGANAEYAETMQIVMHENSRRRLAGSVGAGTTVQTFSDHLPVTVGNRPLHVYYFGKGHTDADSIVVRYQGRIYRRPLRGEGPPGHRPGRWRQRPGAAGDAGSGRQGDHGRRARRHGPWALARQAHGWPCTLACLE